ncbi:MAG: 2-C-methyl-D-erythritol 2,4-cyclodiphosphate synthase [Spirochaetales bacterium]|nr:2-C-methyl-D-erythritol 2,4-cyclodiphosphate synthase [Spirochaetales bacterium]
MSVRVGQGWDLHRLEYGRMLMLGGLHVPSENGEAGHSDGDVLWHAIVDAMLGSIGAGDIGRLFPPSDQRWKDAPSRLFAERAASVLAAAGWRIVNLDTTVILERPKLAPLIDDIRASIAETLGVPVSAVSVKAKTHEGVDAIGRGEAVAAHAVVLVESVG